MKTICKVNENGIYVKGEDEFIKDSDPIADGYVDKQPMIDNGDGTYTGMYIPQWNGTEWIETANQEQINMINNGTEETV